MQFAMQDLSAGQVYHLMIQAIVPRPVAWVLTDSGEGSLNLAPFSYFNGVCSSPPLCMISVGHKRDGAKKDTWRNLEERGHCVVHIASPEQANAVTACAAGLPHGESEIETAGLTTAPWPGQPLPRVVGPKVAFAAKLDRVIEIGDAPQGLILLEITAAWIDDAIAREADRRVRIDSKQLDPLARLGGDDYGRLGETFTVERPR